MSSTQRWIAARCGALSCASTATTRSMLHTRSRSAARVRSDSRGAISRGQRLRVAAAEQHLAEALQEGQCLGGRQGRLVLDGIGDAAQQVGAGDRRAQIRRQLRNRQRKGARDVGENLVLIDFI